jgi:hypothetical protein
MSISDLNIVLDIVLIVASLWMVMTVRGIGGIVGKTLTFIVIGAVILGVAHLLATLTADPFGRWNQTVHRVVVLVGFVFLVYGLRQLKTIK